MSAIGERGGARVRGLCNLQSHRVKGYKYSFCVFPSYTRYNTIIRVISIRYMYLYLSIYLSFYEHKLFLSVAELFLYVGRNKRNTKNKPGTRGRLRKGLQIPMDGLTGLMEFTGLRGLTVGSQVGR